MAFDEELRSYLESLERVAQDKEPVRRRRVDAVALRRHFLERLRELKGNPTIVQRLHAQWSSRIDDFARYVEELPQQDAPVDEKSALAFARKALDHGMNMNVNVSNVDVVEELEAARIANAFHPPDVLELYALENRLIHRSSAGSLVVTALGRVFLRLRGRDAVQWLLTLEVAQSRGNRDAWRASRELLERALSSDGIAWLDEWGIAPISYNVAVLERLARLEVMVAHKAGDDVIYGRVDDAMRDVVQRVLDPGPWHSAVAALLEDERANVLPVLDSRATDAAIEQSRMIAHEVRNALIPVRHHIDALLKIHGAASRKRLESSRRGVVRVLAFVDEMVATSELLDEPLTSFEVADVVRVALGWIDGGERVELDLSGEPIRIRARRSRLQRAVWNVLLNAVQATNSGQRVRARARRAGGMVEVIVDDGGPGVPEESRTIVFQDGFTTRGGVGGSGFGLAFVRKVVEDLNGKVWCETSELGGARFVIALPEGEAEK